MLQCTVQQDHVTPLAEAEIAARVNELFPSAKSNSKLAFFKSKDKDSSKKEEKELFSRLISDIRQRDANKKHSIKDKFCNTMKTKQKKEKMEPVDILCISPDSGNSSLECPRENQSDDDVVLKSQTGKSLSKFFSGYGPLKECQFIANQINSNGWQILTDF